MADNTSQIAGLFMTPEAYQQERRNQFMGQASRLAQMDPNALANFYAMQTGFGAGETLAGALGVQDPMLQQITQQRQLLANVDFTDAKSLGEAARQATSMGRPDIAQQLAQQAINIQSKIEEKQLAREQALQVAKMNIEARIEQARMRGEDQRAIAQMQIEGRRELATLAAALKQGQQAGKPLTTQDIKLANELTASVKDADYGISEAEKFTKMLDQGTIKFGAVENLASKARGLAGSSNASDVAKSDMEKWITASINAVLNQAKGVQARDDAERAQRQIMEALDKNDPKLVRNGVQRIKKLLENTKEDAVSGLELMSQERKRDLMTRASQGSTKVIKLD